MTNSINTNAGALVALRNLNTINRDLSGVQNRVSTGLRISSAKDDASTFAVAQGVRANVKSFEAIAQALSSAKGVISVGIEAATNVSNLLMDVKAKLVQLSDDSLTEAQRQIFTDDLTQQVMQVQSFINRAEFNGINVLAEDEDGNAPSDLQVVQSVDGSALTIRATNLTGVTNAVSTDDPTGFVGFARIAFETDDDDAADSDLTVTAGEYTARTSVSAEQARTALGNYDSGGTTDLVFRDAFANFESEVNNALARLGADNRNVDFQAQFNEALLGATEEGLGALVDADLAKESARLQALQTKQQLAIQTLSIANQAPSIILGLFR